MADAPDLEFSYGEVPQPKTRTGLCRACGFRYVVGAPGTIRRHYQDGQLCPGSQEKPQ